MKAVILAAGEGTRLRPRTLEKPKPLVDVAGTPILTRCLETVRDLGIEEVVVVVGYRKEAIVDRYGESFGDIAIEYAHQPERKGLAHAVLMAEPYVDSDFVVLNGDNIYSANLREVVERHVETDADLTFPVADVSPEEASAGAVCEYEDGDLVGLVEKPAEPPSTRAPTAFYVLPPEVFPACEVVRPSDRGEYELPDAIDLLVHAGYSVETLPFEGWKVNVNTEADVERAEQRLDRQG